MRQMPGLSTGPGRRAARGRAGFRRISPYFKLENTNKFLILQGYRMN